MQNKGNKEVKKEVVTIRLTVEQKRKMRILGAQANMPLASYIRHIIEKHIEEKEKEGGKK